MIPKELAKIKNSYTSIFRQLTTLAWPVVIAFIMQTSYNIVDIFWVGKLGATAIAAVSLAGTVFYVVLAIGQVLGSGTVTLVAQSFGAKLIDKANNVVRQSLLLASLIALLTGIAGFILSKQVMILLGGQDDVLSLSTIYLKIVSIGFFFQLLSFSINYAFRGAGDMKTPMMIMLVATITNIILDPILILGIGFFPRLEVQGAAIATVIAKGLSFLFGFIILTRKKSGIRLRFLEKWRFDPRVVKTILSIGIPVGISYGLMALSGMAVFRIVAFFSKYAIAALGIGIRIFQMASLPVVSIGIATTTIVGQSFGARNLKRAIQTGTVSVALSTVITAIFSMLFITNARFFVTIFTTNSEVIDYGVQFMKIVTLYLVFIGITTSLTGVFRAAGDTLPPMFAGLFKLGLLITLALVLSRNLGMGVVGIWWAMFVSYGIETLVIVLYYAASGWREKGLKLLGKAYKHPRS